MSLSQPHRICWRHSWSDERRDRCLGTAWPRSNELSACEDHQGLIRISSGLHQARPGRGRTNCPPARIIKVEPGFHQDLIRVSSELDQELIRISSGCHQEGSSISSPTLIKLHLGCISATSRLHLGYISAVSRHQLDDRPRHLYRGLRVILVRLGHARQRGKLRQPAQSVLERRTAANSRG